MSTQLPPYVDTVLLQWEIIAFNAYDGYERHGRGVVGIALQEDNIELLYTERDFFVDQGNSAVTELIDSYDPEWEILVLIDAEDGNTRTIRVRTPDGLRHPKRIWFFEMLERVNDDPESLPQELPPWFIKALEDFEK